MSDAQTETPAPDGVTALRPFTYQASENLVELLNNIRASLLISTYQAGKLVAVGVSEGVLNVTLHTFERAMGLAVAHDRIAVGSGPQIWLLQSMPQIAPQLEPPGKFDSCFVTRSSHVTGEVHSHDACLCGTTRFGLSTRCFHACAR